MNAPLSLIAELTHRCPLACPYCSNPLALSPASAELPTEDWLRVIDEAAALGVLQLHLTGGEPMARRDLPALIRRAADRQLYTNLITSGVTLDAARLAVLVEAGLDHIQLSFQDAEAASAERIGGLRGAQARKLAAARLVREAGLPLTANFVVHRQNLDRLADMLALAETLEAQRVEVAHTQYYGWALENRDVLLPSRAQLDAATALVATERVRLAGRMVIDYVVPDYHADVPKACMGGWGQRTLTITPAGLALPCHAAEIIPALEFPSVREHALATIWGEDPAFTRFRGTDWMPDPCRGCALKEADWGGCRCQALLLTGDAAAPDPVCSRVPGRAVVDAAVARAEAMPLEAPFTYRRHTKPVAQGVLPP